MTMPAAKEGPEAAYRRHLAEGRIRLQHCNACKRAHFYPRAVCPHCGSSNLSERETPATGTVYSTTVIREPNALGRAYNVAMIDLDEGVRVLSRVVDVAPDAVRIGLSVKGKVTDSPAGPLLVFETAGR